MTAFLGQFFLFVQITLALSDDNNLIISTVHNGAGLIVARAAVDDNVHQILIAFVDFLRVGEVFADFVFGVKQRSGHDGRAELPDDVGDDGLVGYADADGLLLALEDARDVVIGLQNEGERTGKVALHHLEHVVVDGLGEVAQHAEVVEDKGEIGLLFANALELADALQGLGLVDAASQTVNRVGGEDDDAAVSQTFQNHLDITRVGIGRVKFEYHGFTKNRAKILNCCA